MSQSQRAVPAHFAGRGADRWAGVEWREGASGGPLVYFAGDYAALKGE